MKFLGFLFIACLTVTVGFSQKLYFCEKVDSNGQPSGVSNEFMVNREGSYVNLLFHNDGNFATDSIHFEFYLNGKYFNYTSQKVEKDWDYLYQRIIFKIPGIYTIYVLDDDGKELLFDKLTISLRKN